jgi:hypothetical protein
VSDIKGATQGPQEDEEMRLHRELAHGPIVYVARCPEHGLHGCRDSCFDCGGPVEQVPMVELREPTKEELLRPRPERDYEPVRGPQ